MKGVFLRTLKTRFLGFTLVELLVSMAVLTLIMAMMFAVIGSLQRQTTRSTGNIEAFRAARNAFESITRRISQSTLNTYWAYDDPDQPTRYKRQSELRFASGSASDLIGDTSSDGGERFTHSIFFQAPFGAFNDLDLQSLQSALNSWGYYVEYNSDQDDLPSTLGLTPKNRFRLMEMRQPSEELSVYSVTSGDPDTTSREWLTTPMEDSDLQHPLVDNVLALVLLPKLSSRDDPTGLALVEANTEYLYDSSNEGQGSVNAFYSSLHQLPPIVEVTLVAIDEISAQRLEQSNDLADFKTLLRGLFQTPEDFESDLETLETELRARNLNYRVFSTEVPIQASKWSVE